MDAFEKWWSEEGKASELMSPKEFSRYVWRAAQAACEAEHPRELTDWEKLHGEY